MKEVEGLPERLTDQCADAGSLPALAKCTARRVKMLEWQPRETLPRDATVLVSVSPTEKHSYYPTTMQTVFPAYIDEDGRVCNCGSWEPDSGLDGEKWITTHWMPLPPPPVA